MSFDETREPEPVVWEITRDGLAEPGAIAGYTDADRHLALIQFIGEDIDGWEGDAYDHAVSIRRHHPEPEDEGQVYKVLIFRSLIEERKRSVPSRRLVKIETCDAGVAERCSALLDALGYEVEVRCAG